MTSNVPGYEAQWRYNNPQRAAEIQRRARLKYRYGITAEQYDKLLVSQNGKCAICGTITPGVARQRNFTVDHNHTTSNVRGLLCYRCNTGVGWIENFDDINTLVETLRAYLER
jgi:ribosomal protein L34E